MAARDPLEQLKKFGKCAIETQLLMKERVIAFLYYRAKVGEPGASVAELSRDFEHLGLAVPMTRRIREVLKKDKRTVSIGNDAWKLKSDELKWLDTRLEECLTGAPKPIKKTGVEIARCSDYFTEYKFHPLVEKVSRKQFLSGDYKGAILNAFVEVVEHVKRKTNYPKDKNGRDIDGDPLMNIVFGCDNGSVPFIPFNPLQTDLDKSEQRGLMYLYKGIVGIRNRKAHLNFIQRSTSKTLEYLSLASLLLRLLDEQMS